KRRCKKLSELAQRSCVSFINQSAPVWRHIQKKTRAASDRVVVQPKQLGRGFYFGTLTRVPKPTRTNRDVALGRHPVLAVSYTVRRFAFHNIARRSRSAVGRMWCVRGPARLTGSPVLIAYPPHVRANVTEEHRAGLKLTFHLPGIRPVVVM